MFKHQPSLLPFCSFLYEGKAPAGYKHVYFNITSNTLKIWALTVVAAIAFYECVLHCETGTSASAPGLHDGASRKHFVPTLL